MKLAYLSAAKLPSREANSIHVMKMCQALSHLGQEVTLVAPDVVEGLEPGVSDIYDFYGVDRCFEVRKLPWRPVKGRGWIYGWEAGRFAQLLGVDTVFGRSLHACAVAARAGLPTSWDAHMLSFLMRWDERRLFRWMIGAPAFRHVFVNCGALGDCILEQVRELEGQIVVAHNGADELAEGVVAADLAGGGRPQVGYVGHLYAGKGFEIIRRLAAQVPAADFHVVGGEQETLDRLRADSTLPNNIRLHGFVPPAETERLCLAFDVLLAPYQSDVRIAGGGGDRGVDVPAESVRLYGGRQAHSLLGPPGPARGHRDGRNGILVPPDNVEAWAAALQRLLDDDILRQRLGATAHADFLARHTWRRRASRVLESFESSNAGAGTGRP